MSREISIGQKQFETDLKNLSEKEEFARFLNWIYQERENDIMSLHDANVESIQQIAGSITKCDQILKVAGWDHVRKKWDERI